MSDAKTQEARLSETGPFFFFFARKPKISERLKEGVRRLAGSLKSPGGPLHVLHLRAPAPEPCRRPPRGTRNGRRLVDCYLKSLLLLWQRAPVRIVWAAALADLFMAWTGFRSQMVRLMRTIYTSPGLVFKADAMHPVSSRMSAVQRKQRTWNHYRCCDSDRSQCGTAACSLRINQQVLGGEYSQQRSSEFLFESGEKFGLLQELHMYTAFLCSVDKLY